MKLSSCELCIISWPCLVKDIWPIGCFPSLSNQSLWGVVRWCVKTFKGVSYRTIPSVFPFQCCRAIVCLMAEDIPSMHAVCINMIGLAGLLCGPTGGAMLVASGLLHCVSISMLFSFCFFLPLQMLICCTWRALSPEKAHYPFGVLCAVHKYCNKTQSAQSCSFRVDLTMQDMDCCDMFSLKKTQHFINGYLKSNDNNNNNKPYLYSTFHTNTAQSALQHKSHAPSASHKKRRHRMNIKIGRENKNGTTRNPQ